MILSKSAGLSQTADTACPAAQGDGDSVDANQHSQAEFFAPRLDLNQCQAH
jgi:hypothetical protein